MALKQQCIYCLSDTIAIRMIGIYVGSPKKVDLWECRECHGIWSNKSK